MHPSGPLRSNFGLRPVGYTESHIFRSCFMWAMRQHRGPPKNGWLSLRRPFKPTGKKGEKLVNRAPKRKEQGACWFPFHSKFPAPEKKQEKRETDPYFPVILEPPTPPETSQEKEGVPSRRHRRYWRSAMSRRCRGKSCSSGCRYPSGSSSG